MQIQISQEGCLNPLLCCIHMRRLQMEISPFFFFLPLSFYGDCLRQKARGAQQEVRDLIIRLRLCGCTYFLPGLSSRALSEFIFPIDLTVLFEVPKAADGGPEFFLFIL